MNKELTIFDLEKYLVETKLNPLNKQLLFRFPNDFGASVIIGPYTYGGDQGLYELGVIKWSGDDWHLYYDTPITDDVIGYLTPKKVGKFLDDIMALPKDCKRIETKNEIN